MPFTQVGLHPSLLQGIKELGFVRPTPIQAEAIPPAMQGKDVIATAQTGSGKTAAFLLPILNRLIDKPRRTTRALVLAPTRELAAQILEDFNALAVHTPVTGAAVFGGVGMGPQEHAFRSGVDMIVATPGRLLDHMRSSYAKMSHLEHLVLDEADRMLDMGFLPEIRRILTHLPTKRQTLFFSATMPPPIAALAAEMLRHPVTIQLQRHCGAGRRHHAGRLPGAAGAEAAARGAPADARHDDAGADLHAHQAPRQPAGRVPGRAAASRPSASTATARRRSAPRRSPDSGTAPIRCSSRPTSPPAASTSRRSATSSTSTCRWCRRTTSTASGARAAPRCTGEAFTFVSPQEESELKAIERVIGRRLPRVTVPDFDYAARPQTKLEVPLAQRIAEIRARKRGERERASANAARRSAAHRGRPVPPAPPAGEGGRRPQRPSHPGARPFRGRGRGRGQR